MRLQTWLKTLFLGRMDVPNQDAWMVLLLRVNGSLRLDNGHGTWEYPIRLPLTPHCFKNRCQCSSAIRPVGGRGSRSPVLRLRVPGRPPNRVRGNRPSTRWDPPDRPTSPMPRSSSTIVTEAFCAKERVSTNKALTRPIAKSTTVTHVYSGGRIGGAKRLLRSSSTIVAEAFCAKSGSAPTGR